MTTDSLIHIIDSLRHSQVVINNNNSGKSSLEIFSLIIVPLVALLTVFVNIIVTNRIIKANREQMKDENLIKTKLEWIELIRETLSEYVSKLFYAISLSNDENFDSNLIREFLKYNYKLKLLITSEQKREGKLFYELLEFNEDMHRYFFIHNEKWNSNGGRLQDTADDLVELSRIMFNQEWNSIKDNINYERHVVDKILEIEKRLKNRKEQYELIQKKLSERN